MLGPRCCAGFSLVVTSRGSSLATSTGFSLQWLLSLQSVGSDHMSFSSCSSQAIESRLNVCGALVQLSCSTACGTFSDQRSDLCLLHWQVDS